MVRPPFETVNAVFPASAAPEAPLTPPDGPLTTVTWPPVGKVCLPSSIRSTESLAGL